MSTGIWRKGGGVGPPVKSEGRRFLSRREVVRFGWELQREDSEG